jgi:hypothetical protein
MHEWMFDLGATVVVSCSGEVGEVTGRSQHQHSEDQYLLRYRANDGRAVESWWGQSALEQA